MANKQDYLSGLRAAIWRLESCGAVHHDTVRINESFQGKTVWEGNVEVLDLMQPQKPNALTPGHIWKAKRTTKPAFWWFWNCHRLKTLTPLSRRQ
jgi:hypothetical protein